MTAIATSAYITKNQLKELKEQIEIALQSKEPYFEVKMRTFIQIIPYNLEENKEAL